MSARLRAIAQHTEEIVRAGRYQAPDGREVVIAPQVEAALSGTRMYGPGPVPVPGGATATGTVALTVTGESSTEAARRLALAGSAPVAVLNFASARNPGGGYLNGAQAQEEALCRASALHTTLLRAPDYYAHHRADRDPFYSDRVIHSPGVPVFRDERGALLAEPYTVGFLTSPAPNAGVILRTAPERAHLIPAALASRAERVLQTAAAHGYRRLVLGAWGCGVFRNDPAEVAGAFRALLTGSGRFAGRFDEAVFAVLDRTRERRVLGAFRTVLRPAGAEGPAGGGQPSGAGQPVGGGQPAEGGQSAAGVQP
ncbi:TIGR02452 family protein [Streptomyces lichenis]|uniref:TIGR02452 family protein n=1 Tax=Streptomyces lichenis TaxID=2306967 RepID=A0ABT0IJS9_9ACTN|nr:TIGR02452 family protein [Streptomyces lichenis]MCK8681527.1 TIGR02452 family protein [Streptomyces lichenis]